MLNKFWQKIGLGKSGYWQKIKWVIISVIFTIPNILFYFIYRLGEITEKFWFNCIVPSMWNWIKK